MHYSLNLVIFSVMLIYCLQFCAANPGTNETDRIALLDFKAKVTDDPLGVMTSWNDTVHFCGWYGVTCGGMHQRVTVLDLHHSKLKGILSPYLGNLSCLKEVYLNNNSFDGTIPSEIGRLQSLQILLLSNNFFEGKLPSNISSCVNLIKLDVHNNKLVGNIASELGYLPHLQFLSLSTNNFTSIIPSSLGNLSSLSKLFIAENSLDGSIPHNIGNLKKLTILALGKNSFSGTVPSSLFNLSLLTTFDLGYNKLEGIIPSDIGYTLPYLQWFSFGNNRFRGNIPSSLFNNSNLEALQLNMNKLRGQVPSLHKLERLVHLSFGGNFLGNDPSTDLDFISSLTNATMLQTLYIDSNNFTAILPTSICNFSKLAVMSIQDNHIAGNIPICIENLVELQAFGADYNALSGLIPQSIGKLHNLRSLFLNSNLLSGEIPPSIGNLTQLNMLSLSSNNLVGKIPRSIGNYTSLLGLDLSLNNLSGTIPLELFSLSSLSVGLVMYSNRLSGSLPQEIGQLINLEGLDVSENMLSGEIPGSLSSCVPLSDLELQENFFQGAIPDALSSLKGLQMLNLSRNNLSGKIPKFLTNIQLTTLNLAYNNFEGEVPIGGVFSNESEFSVAGNNRLCGGIPELKLPRCQVSYETRKTRPDHKRRILVVAILCGCIGVVFLVSLFLYLFWYRQRIKKTEPSSDSKNFPNLPYHTLLRATNGFSLENVIGNGAFGVVYKGSIEDNDSIVAIKVFKLEQCGASKSFNAECEVFRWVRHRHLVKVITACSSIDYQGRDFKALVYEYMVNGSMEDWLHQAQVIYTVEGMQRGPVSFLNLHQRLDIVVHVAFALDYLHNHCGDPIVHCDLKPSNILLDNEVVAHISDFGLAKFKYSSNSLENQSLSIGVKGTVGYTPPEYGLGNEVSTSGDVYSFGIILLEMFTRKRPTNDMFKEGFSLHSFVKEAIPQHMMIILDQKLLEDINKEEIERSNHILEALTSIFEIALSCSNEIPQERLNIADVSTKLSSIRNKLFETRRGERRRNQAGTQV